MGGGQGGRGGERGVSRGQADGAGRGRVAQAVVEGLAKGGEAAAAALVEVGVGQQGISAGDTATAGAGHWRRGGGGCQGGGPRMMCLGVICNRCMLQKLNVDTQLHATGI